MVNLMKLRLWDATLAQALVSACNATVKPIRMCFYVSFANKLSKEVSEKRNLNL